MNKPVAIVTVIIPVYNSPWLVDNAIRSMIDIGTTTPYRVVVYDDGSDDFTLKLIKSLQSLDNRLTIKTTKQNRGYIQTVNAALKDCKSKYALLVNSDVILTPGCLDRLVAAAEKDKTIATVNPLTNRASHIDIALPPGINFLEADKYVQRHFRGALDIVTGVGFCMLLRMEALHKIGYFDEIYGVGYCEESDLCMRLTTNGWRTVVTPDTYVYHKGSGSFDNKRERYLLNRRIFDKRWDKEYKEQFKSFQQANPLGPIRLALTPPHRHAPVEHARQVYRRTRIAFRNKNAKEAANALIKGVMKLPQASLPKVSRSHIQKYKNASSLSVTYLLPYLTVAGGVISVIQLVNELILQGFDARLAAFRAYPETEAWPQYVGTMLYQNANDMIENMQETDIVVATHWTTARVAHNLLSQGKAKKAVYFVQDYEPWFYAEKAKKQRHLVEQTYRLLDNKIVKSDWLSQKLATFGGNIRKIHLGMDLRIFYPRVDRNQMPDRPPTLLAMARPRTPRRGFSTLVAGLRMVKKKHPDVRIRFFGDYLNAAMAPFNFEDLGIITDQNLLAQLYSEADVFIDASDFQGFGRTALEAMACGAACVLTGVGGVTEYVQDAENALVIPPKDPDALCEAVCKLINDQALRKKLTETGRKTVKQFCHKREAGQTAQYMAQLAGKHNCCN